MADRIHVDVALTQEQYARVRQLGNFFGDDDPTVLRKGVDTLLRTAVDRFNDTHEDTANLLECKELGEHQAAEQMKIQANRPGKPQADIVLKILNTSPIKLHPSKGTVSLEMSNGGWWLLYSLIKDRADYHGWDGRKEVRDADGS